MYKRQAVAKDQLPVTSLKATLENGGNVNSDYFSLLLATTEFEDIFLDNKVSLMANATAADRELKDLGTQAIEGVSVLPILYNNVDGFNLKEHILVSFTTTDLVGKTFSGKLTLAQLEEKWGLTAQFGDLHYLLGNSATEENAFLDITEDGVLTARFVKEAGKDPVLTDGSAAAKSALGKLPVVAVTIMNGNNVVLAGFVKCEITEESQVVKPSQESTVIATSGLYPILCTGDDFTTNWDQFAQLFATLGCSKDFFTQNYKCDNFTYVKSGDNFVKETKYGTLAYGWDTTNPATTTILTWDYSTAAVQNILSDKQGTVTLYTKFTYGSRTVFVGMTVKVADKPEISLGSLKPGYKKGENHVMMNVPTIRSGNSVLDFEAKVENYYNGDQIKVTLTSGAPYTRAMITENGPTFKFSTNGQMSGVKPNTAGNELIHTATGDVIATLAADGTVAYGNSKKALELLNSGTNPWAVVSINYTYGTCNLEFGKIENKDLKIEFIRPVDVLAGSSLTVNYDGVNVKAFQLGSLFNIFETVGNNKLFLPDGKSFKDNQGLYEFYDVQSVDIDLTACQTYMDVTLVDANGNDVTPVAGTKYKYNAVDISNVADLGNYSILFDYNTETLVHEQTVNVKMVVNYSWGSQSVTIPVTLKPYK